MSLTVCSLFIDFNKLDVLQQDEVPTNIPTKFFKVLFIQRKVLFFYLLKFSVICFVTSARVVV